MRFEEARNLLAVLVAPPRQVDDDDPLPVHTGGLLAGLSQGVGALQGGQDALQAATASPSVALT